MVTYGDCMVTYIREKTALLDCKGNNAEWGSRGRQFESAHPDSTALIIYQLDK